MPRKPSTHIDDRAAVGARLRQAREAAGLTQRQLSFEGCTAAYISRIEAGARVPSLQILREFAQRLGVTADYLATGLLEGEELGSGLLEAEVALRTGDEERAIELYEAARADAESARELALAHLGLGRLALRKGETRRGIALLEQAIESDALPAADASSAASALGRSYASEGRLDEAAALFSRFLELARSRNDRFDEVRFSVMLANTYIDQANFGRAQEILGDILDQARQTIDPMLRASLYWSQSRVYLSQSQPDRAAEYAQLTVATLRSTEQTLEAARALLLLAMIENDRGNPKTALELVDEGEPTVAAVGDDAESAMFTIERARALAALDEREQAAALLLGIVPRLNSAAPVNAARAYAGAADVFRSQGDTVRALELYELAVETSPVPNRHVAEAMKAMAEIYEETGEPQKALELLKQAFSAQHGVRT
jgi:tetratricopeptide (TPR) repeat protein